MINHNKNTYFQCDFYQMQYFILHWMLYISHLFGYVISFDLQNKNMDLENYKSGTKKTIDSSSEIYNFIEKHFQITCKWLM